MHYSFKPSGVCCQNISFDIENNKIKNIVFTNGCPGNLKMISKLLEEKDLDYVISICSGNKCGFKSTSCADQLARAVSEAKSKIINN